MKIIGNYAFDQDARKWVRRWTLDQFTNIQWGRILQHNQPRYFADARCLPFGGHR